MSVEIVINAAPEETRVALLENRTVTEFYFDRKRDRGMMGNVYKGRVAKVLPGMQAAFVDIGMEKAAFLYVADIMPPRKQTGSAVAGETEETEEMAADPDGIVEEAEEAEGAEDMDEEGADALDEMEEETEEADGPVQAPSAPRQKRGPLVIEEMLKEGQEIMVQVSKEPIGTKGPRVTTYVSLPGRYLVYLPTVNHVGVSRRIGQAGERQRLKAMIRKLRKPGAGYIVRTVSDGMTEEALKQDMEFLEGVWQGILKNQESLAAPALLHNDLDLIFRTVRDLFTKDVDRLTIDSKPEYERIKSFVSTYLSGFLDRIELWEKEEPIFDAYGLELDLSKARNRRVWLKSGGYIVLDRAEALTVIDVNTGRFVGKKDLEETILKTNLEAAKEVAYQIRLRNIGGIIIIDFIDMEKEKNREKVFAALSEGVARDKAKSRLLKISELGLVQMSRERTREDIARSFCEPCPYCEGRGHTKSPETLCHEIFREIRRIGPVARGKKVMIGVHPSVASLLCDEKQERVEALERAYRKKMIVKADVNLHVEQYEIVPL